MSDYRQVLQAHPGLLVRQRLRLKNLIPCMLKNKYDIGSFPMNMDQREPWPDSVFKHQKGLLYATEDSTCIDKCCCGRYRAFTMLTYHGSTDSQPPILRYHRPFKCPIVCCCWMPWPQELHTVNPVTNQEIGQITQDWRCMSAVCGKFYWRVSNGTGTLTHVIEQNLCCNANCFAPSCCCPIHRFDIMDASEQNVIGTIENIFPGCSLRTLFCSALIDNYRLTYPTQATPEDKANLLGAVILIDFMVFERATEENNQALAQ